MPVLGFRWAAAAGEVSLNGMILPAALYFWQIPHFLALAYLCRDDYAAGGYAFILHLEFMKFSFMSTYMGYIIFFVVKVGSMALGSTEWILFHLAV